eukprot:gene14466-9050_t
MDPAAKKRLPIAAAWLLATATVNGLLAWSMWGERGVANRRMFKVFMEGNQTNNVSGSGSSSGGGGDAASSGASSIATPTGNAPAAKKSA